MPRIVGLVLLLMSVCFACSQNGGLDPDSVRANNRGVALMGRFDYEGARQAFQELHESIPENDDVLVNLAIATLNRQKEGDEQLALTLLQDVLERNPEHLRALYCSALLYLQLGQPEKARAALSKVVELDPDDAAAVYFLGQAEMQLGNADKAIIWYRKAVAGDPFLRSAYYRGFQALQRLREVDEAQEYLAEFRRLEKDPRGRLVEFKYTKMGSKAMVATLGREPVVRRPEPVEGALFEDPGSVLAAAETNFHAAGPSSINVADLNGDGQLDLLLGRALDNDESLVLLGRDNGSFAVESDHQLAGIQGVNAALFGDVDNDGRVDVYLCRDGANQLWRQFENGQFQESAGATILGNTADTRDGALVDADHDGDLDIFLVNHDAPNELINNNRDGSFRALGESQGVAGDGRPSTSLVVTDVDNDRDLDLLIIKDSPPHELWLNDLQWEYHRDPVWTPLEGADFDRAVAADLDSNGQVEIYTADAAGELSRWRSDGGELRQEVVGVLAGSQNGFTVADISGDGSFEFVAASDSGYRVARLSGDDLQILEQGETPITAFKLVNIVGGEPGRGPGLVAMSGERGITSWAPGPGRHPFVSLQLSGREDGSGSLRSNASGIGSRIALRVGSRWTLTHQLRSSSAPGQDLQPVVIGLGPAERADFVVVDWSDGVMQTEMDLGPEELHLITETQRQLSSCPVLFAWNGEDYQFISDLLGVGGIGYALGAPGEYGQPRPHENLMLPEGAVAPRDGRIILKLGEPMEEVTYLDAVRLVAYDLPEGWSMTVDERMGILGPQPTGEVRFYRHLVEPYAAENGRGQSIIDEVSKADLNAAPVGALDHRFIGMLETSNTVILYFDEDISREGAMLIADGWVEYPYSQTNFAAWQAAKEYRAATLEARAGGRDWHLVQEQFGYPAGMPRQMVLPLENLPPGTRQLRIHSNQEIYWDRLAVAFAETPETPVVVHHLALEDAELRQVGYPLRSTGAQRLPDYDYGRRSPVWDVKYLAGRYTRFGEVNDLLAEIDSAVAIFGAGEEIHMEFAAPPAAEAGVRRVYVIETNGWCKDMDLYTRDGQTIDPVPRLEGAPAQIALNEQYNTRILGGRE